LVKKFVAILILATLAQAGFAQKSIGPANNATSKLVHFFPNPASAFINFEFKQPVEQGSVIQFYSFLGRKMNSQPISGNRVTVNLTEFITGIYIFQVRDASGRLLESNKFQVAK